MFGKTKSFETKALISDVMTGIKLSVETKAKLSEANKGKTH